MADIELGLGSDAARAVSAILFIQASTNAMDVYSALNSSPWTAQSFGADPEKRKACMEYVHHSLGVTLFYSASATVLARNWWPMIGWSLASGYMYWLYQRALKRAQDSGSTSWDGKGSSNGDASTQAQAPAQNGNGVPAGGSYPWN
jgi:hypothetical protein